jgi:MerR family transcriptional regulator, copper efflux regulator
MTVGQVARRAGLSPRAVRFYEAEGLLPPAQRTASGYRHYADHELELLRFVRQLRSVGLSLADVREVIRIREHGVPAPGRVITMLEARIAVLDRELESLPEARGRLVEVLHRAHLVVGGSEEVRLCRLVGAASANAIAASGLGPEA